MRARVVMAKQKAKAATPRLRFPEFRGAWVEKLLKKICDVNPSNSGLPDSFFYIDLESVEEGVLKSKNSIEKASAPSRAQRLLRKGDVLFQTVRPYQRNNLHFKSDNAEPHVASTGYAQLRAKNSASFLYQLVHTDAFVDKVIAKCTGSNYPAINSTDLANVRCLVPDDPAEQQKIAACLASLDEVIAAQGRKVEALKAHKRGLMQQLFPREGETRPRVRFPEFRDAPEWKKKLGGELFQHRKEGGRDGLPIYSVTVHDGMIPRASFDRDFYDIQDPAKNKMAHEGDIAYNMMRMWQGAQGVAVEDCMVSPAYVVLAPLEGVCSNFFGYLLKLPHSLELLTAYSRGLTKDRLRLYFDDFARMPLCVPGHEEQQRIADCLASLDTRITAETARLAALKTHKQGLMQQLFPAPEAMGT